MRRWILVVSIALLGGVSPLAAAPALADPQFEISLLGGGTFGGDFRVDEASGDFGSTWNVGGMIGIRPRPDDRQVFFVSYQFQRSDLDLEIKNRPPTSLPVFIGHAHGGVEVDGELFPRLHPFLNVSLGATHYTPDREGTETTWFFSTGLRGGVKVPITSWLGLRLQAGMMATVIGDGKDIICVSNGSCIPASDALGVIQGDAAGGLYLRF